MPKAPIRLVALVAVVAAVFMSNVPPPRAAEAIADVRFFPQTGFRIDNDAFFTYFNARGGVPSFGYPVSRTFRLQGFTVQFFQRAVMQQAPDGSARLLNLLDPGLMPFNSFNGAVVPAFDPALVATAPPPGSPSYGTAIFDYVRRVAVDTWNGTPVRFGATFFNISPDAALELWGVPTSNPAADPNNPNFVYQRFQRGIMHFDAGCSCTQGLLLADYFKAIITGQNLPPDVAAEAKGSPFFGQYNNAKPQGMNNPTALPGSDLTNAFEPQQPQASLPPNDYRYGFAAFAIAQDQQRIMDYITAANFGWIKQQVRWSDNENVKYQIKWSDLDPVVNAASASGLRVLFSVVTSPRWARGDRQIDGPPDNNNDLGDFVAALAQRYKGKVQAYEIWNEENFSREWGGRPINPGAYVEMLRVAHYRIKAVDPNAIVVSGALTPTGVNDPAVAVDDAAYLTSLYQYQNGVFKTLADAVGVHTSGYNNPPQDYVDLHTYLAPCYDANGTPLGTTSCFKDHPSFYFRRIDDLHQIMQQAGDNRPVWITEYEWGAANPPVPPGYEWTLSLTESQVGDYYVQGIQSIQQSRPWVAEIFVWNLNWRTFANPSQNESAIFGVLNGDWSPRSIYTKLAQMPK